MTVCKSNDILLDEAWVLVRALERQLCRTRRGPWSEGGERELNRGTWANQVGVHVVALWACTFT
jgi:hypothetical protein